MCLFFFLQKNYLGERPRAPQAARAQENCEGAPLPCMACLVFEAQNNLSPKRGCSADGRISVRVPGGGAFSVLVRGMDTPPLVCRHQNHQLFMYVPIQRKNRRTNSTRRCPYHATATSTIPVIHFFQYYYYNSTTIATITTISRTLQATADPSHECTHSKTPNTPTTTRTT